MTISVESQNGLMPWQSPDTPELAPPSRQADAHRVQVAGVTLLVRESGDSIYRIALVSQDTGATINDDLWLPRGYAENVKVDPTSLPESENFAENQRGKYASTIHNSKNTATLDRYFSYAYAQGHTDFSSYQAATDANSVAEALNEILSGTDLIIVRKPQKKNPDFLNIASRADISEEANPKFLNRLEKGDVLIRWM